MRRVRDTRDRVRNRHTGTHTKFRQSTSVTRGGAGPGPGAPLSLADCVLLSVSRACLSVTVSLSDPSLFPQKIDDCSVLFVSSKRQLPYTRGRDVRLFTLGLFSPITRYSELVTAPQSIAPEPPRTARAPRVPKRAADATRSPISKTAFVPLQRGQSCGAAQRARAIALSRALRACSCAVACAQGRSKWSAIGGSGKWSKGCAGGEAPPLRASRPPSPGAQPLPPPA